MIPTLQCLTGRYYNSDKVEFVREENDCQYCHLQPPPLFLTVIRNNSGVELKHSKLLVERRPGDGDEEETG